MGVYDRGKNSPAIGPAVVKLIKRGDAFAFPKCVPTGAKLHPCRQTQPQSSRLSAARERIVVHRLVPRPHISLDRECFNSRRWLGSGSNGAGGEQNIGKSGVAGTVKEARPDSAYLRLAALMWLKAEPV